MFFTCDLIKVFFHFLRFIDWCIALNCKNFCGKIFLNIFINLNIGIIKVSPSCVYKMQESFETLSIRKLDVLIFLFIDVRLYRFVCICPPFLMILFSLDWSSRAVLVVVIILVIQYIVSSYSLALFTIFILWIHS